MLPIIFIATYRRERYYDGAEIAVCFTSADTFWSSFYFIGSITVFFALPFFVLVLLYAAIAYKLLHRNSALRPPVSPVSTLQQHTKPELSQNFIQKNAVSIAQQQRPRKRQQHQQNSNMRKNRKQVIFMLVTVVASFFICLLPFRAFTLWVISSSPSDLVGLGIDGYYNLLYFCRVMLYLNSALNPILYNIMSSKFRNGFWLLIIKCFGGHRTNRQQLHGHKRMRHRLQSQNQNSDILNKDKPLTFKRHFTFINSTTSSSSATGNELSSWQSNSTSTSSFNNITSHSKKCLMRDHQLDIVDKGSRMEQ